MLRLSKKIQYELNRLKKVKTEDVEFRVKALVWILDDVEELESEYEEKSFELKKLRREYEEIQCGLMLYPND